MNWDDIKSHDSSVGIATGYGLCGQGSNPGRSNIFLSSTASRPALGPTQLPVQWVPRDISPGGRAAVEWSWPLTSI
jgi:hypothetical protein